MEKKYVNLNNDEKYAYLEKGKGNKNLILVHGNFSSSVYFKPLIELLPDDIHIYAMDLRGFGDSSYNSRVYSLKDLADDIYLFMEKLDINKADVLGWSLGGGVVMEFAVKYPEKLDKLILLNSTSYKGYPVFKKDDNNQMKIGEVYSSREEMANDPVQVKPILDALETNNKDMIKAIFNMTIYTVNKPGQKDYDLYVEDSLKQRNLVDVDFALASLNLGDETNLYTKGDNSISDIKADTLHIWGTQDKTVPENMIKDNIKAIKNSTYIKFDECGHSPLVDKPKELAKAIKEFID